MPGLHLYGSVSNPFDGAKQPCLQPLFQLRSFLKFDRLLADANRKTDKREWLLCVYSLADVFDEPALLEASMPAAARFAKQWSKCRPDTSPAYFCMAPFSNTYGSYSHIHRQARNMVEVGHNLYMNICVNSQHFSAIDIIGVESGAFLVKRLLEFIDYHGAQFIGNTRQLDMAWVMFFAHGIVGKREENNILSPLIRNVMLVHPSLPSPTGIAKLLWSWVRLPVYLRTNWQQCENETLTANTGQRKYFVALLTDLGNEEKTELSHEGAIEARNEEITGTTLMKIPRDFNGKAGYSEKYFHLHNMSGVVEWFVDQDRKQRGLTTSQSNHITSSGSTPLPNSDPGKVGIWYDCHNSFLFRV